MKIHPVFHASRLSPFVVDTIPKRTPERLPAVVTPQGEEEYEVEEILASGLTGGRNPKIKYKVKWKGYGDAEQTWEPLDNLANAQDAIKAFHRAHPAAPRPVSQQRARALFEVMCRFAGQTPEDGGCWMIDDPFGDDKAIGMLALEEGIMS